MVSNPHKPLTVVLIVRWWARRPAFFRHAALLSTALTGLTAPAFAQTAPPANTLPTGGAVVGGTATISTNTTAVTETVAQTSARAAINWTNFSVGSNGTVTFNQPSASAITLNQVTTANPSLIAGRINANGQIVIANPNGVVFFQGSQVDVATLLVSTATMSQTQRTAFVNGTSNTLTFDTAPAAGASITNNGTLTMASAGLAALVAPQVANNGVITATLGRVILGGALTYTLDLYGDGLTALNVTNQVTTTSLGTASPSSLVVNSGTINAPGGQVVMTAQAADGVITNLVEAGGTVNAQTSGTTPGTVLVSGVGGDITVDGDIQANGVIGAGTSGGVVSAVTDGTVVLASEALVDVSGDTGGGAITLQGQTVLDNASPGVSQYDNSVGSAGVTAASTSGTVGTLTIHTSGPIYVGDDLNGFVQERGSLCPTGATCLSYDQLGGSAGTAYQPSLIASGGDISLIYTNISAYQAATNLLDVGSGAISLATLGTGDIDFDNGITVSAGALAASAGGSIDLASTVGATIDNGAFGPAASTPPAITTISNLTLQAGGNFVFSGGTLSATGGNIVMTAGSGPLDLGINLNAGNTVVLSSTDPTSGGIGQGSGGVISASSIEAFTSTGDITLTSAANAIGELVSAATTGTLAFTDSAPLIIGGTVSAGGNVNIDVLGNNASGQPDTLSLSGNITAGGTAAFLASGGITQVAGTIAAPAISLYATGGNIAVSGTLSAGTLSSGVYNGSVALYAPGGEIEEDVTSGTIGAGTLAASAADEVALGGTNTISTVGSTTLFTDPVSGTTSLLAGLSAGGGIGVLLDDTVPLTISSNIDASYGAATINDGVTGTPATLTLEANILGPSVALEATGGITQAGGTYVDGPSGISLTAQDGDIDFAGQLSSFQGTNNGVFGQIGLSAPHGNITEITSGSYTGEISTVDLGAHASGSITLDSTYNSFSAIGPTAGGVAGVIGGDNVSLVDFSTLTVSGDLIATSGTLGVTLLAGEEGPNDLTLNSATVGAGTDASLAVDGSITQNGGTLRAGNNLSLTAYGTIDFSGTLAAGSVVSGVYTGHTALYATGQIAESGAASTVTGQLNTGVLAAYAGGGINLENPANIISTIGSATLTNPFLGTTTTVAGIGTYGSSGIGVLIDDSVPLTISQPIYDVAGAVGIYDGSAGTPVALSVGATIAAPDIRLESTGSFTQTAGTISATSGFLFISAGGGDLDFGGTFAAGSATSGIHDGTTYLEASGSIAETANGSAGTLETGTLYANAGGDITLGTPSDASTGNQIESLNYAGAGGNLTLVDGQALDIEPNEGPTIAASSINLVAPAITLNGQIDGNGLISLISDQFNLSGSVIDANSAGSATGTIALDLLHSGTFTVGSGGTLPSLSNLSAGTIALGTANGTTPSAPDDEPAAGGTWGPDSAGQVTALDLNEAVSVPGTLALFSDGTIDSTIGITAAELTGAAGYEPVPGSSAGTTNPVSVTITGTNSIPTLGTFTLYGPATPSFTFDDGTSLTLSGQIDGGTPTSGVTIDNPDIAIAVSGTGNTLTADASLTGHNIFLATEGTGVSGTALSITSGTNITAAGGSLDLAAASGDIAFGGTLTAGTATSGTYSGTTLISAGGSMTAANGGGQGAIDTGTLAISAPSGTIDLSGSNSISSVGSGTIADPFTSVTTPVAGLVASGGITLADLVPLTIADPVLASSGVVQITDGPAGTPVALDVAANVTGNGVTLDSTGGITQTSGRINANGDTLVLSATDGSINFAGTLAGGAVTLNAPQGQIAETPTGTPTGVLSAVSLTATANGPIDLPNNSNLISGTTGVTTSGNITLEDSAPLTVSGALTATSGTLDVTVLGTGNGLTLQSATLAGGTGATLTAAGAIAQNGGSLAAGTGLLLVSAGGSITADGTLSGTGATLLAGGGITESAGSLTAGTGPLVLTANSGPIDVNATLTGTGAALSATGAIDESGSLDTGTGALTLNAGGTISATGVLSAGSATFTAGSGIAETGGSLTATGPIAFTANGGSIDLFVPVTGTAATLSATGAIDESGSLDTGTGALTLNAGGTIGTTGILSAGSATFTAGSAIAETGGSLNATGPIAFTANGGGIDIDSALSGLGATLSATGDIDESGSLNAGTGTLTWTAGGNISATGTLAGTGASLAAGGAIAETGGSLNAGTGPLSLVAGGGAIDVAAALSGTGATLSATGDIADSGSLAAGNGPLTMSAGGDITLAGSATAAGADLTANGAFTETSGAVLSTPGALTLNASGGDIAFGGTIAAGTAALTAPAGKITETVAGSQTGVLSAGTLAALADGVIDLADANNRIATIAPLGTLTGLTAGGIITLADNEALTTSGAIASTTGQINLGVLGTGNALTLQTTSFTAASGVILTAPGTITQTGGGISAGGAITILAGGGIAFNGTNNATSAYFSAGGSIGQTGGTLNAGGGALSLYAHSGIVADGTDSAGNATLAAGTGVTQSGSGSLAALGSASFTATSGSIDLAGTTSAGTGITISAGQDIVQSGTLFTTSGALTMTAGAAITADGDAAAGSAVLAAGGGITQSSAGSLATTGPISFTANSGSIDLAGNLAGTGISLNASQDVSQTTGLINAGAGALTMNAGDTIALDSNSEAGSATFLAASGITLRGGAQLSATDTADLTASNGPITIGGTLDAGSGITLTAGGASSNSIFVQSGGTIFSNSGTVALNAADTITANGTIDGGDVTLLAPGGIAESGAGNIGALNSAALIASSGSITLAGGVGGAFTTISAGGDVTQTGGTIGAVETGGLGIGAGGNITIAGYVGAGYGTSLAAGGSITETPTGSIQAYRHLTLDASSGNIQFAGSLSDTGDAELDAPHGTISETVNGATGVISTYGLAANAGGAIDLSNPANTIGAIGPSDTDAGLTAGGNITLADNFGLFVSGSLATTNGTLDLTLYGAGNALTLNDATVSAPAGITISAPGDIIQNGGSIATSGTLALTAGDGTGSLYIGGTNTAAYAVLSATGGQITQDQNGATGSLAAGTLTATALGPIDLTGVNAIATIGAAGVTNNDPGGITLNDTTALNINGPVTDLIGDITVTDGTAAPVNTTVAANVTALDVSISATGAVDQTTGIIDSTDSPLFLTAANGDITIGGTLTGNQVGLSAPNGSITESGTIDAGTLAANGSGPIDLGQSANQIGTIGTVGPGNGITTGGDVTITDGESLTITGPISSTNGSIAVTTPGSITQTGNASAATSLTYGAPVAITISGDLSAPNIVLGLPAPIGQTGTQQVTINGGTILTSSGLNGEKDVPKLLPTTGPGFYIQANNITQTGTTTVDPLTGTQAVIELMLQGQKGLIKLDPGGGIDSPQGNLLLGLGPTGSVSGNINVGNLNVYYSGGGTVIPARLTGSVAGIGGTEAAAVGFIHASANSSYQINNCPVQAVDCILLSPLVVPIDNPIDTVFVGTTRRRRRDQDLALPDVSAVDY